MKEKKLLSWKTLHSKLAYTSPWCSVREDIVQLPNGEVVKDYTVVQLRDVVMIFALTQDNRILFVRQYRYGVNKVLLELPAGTYVKNKEAPEEAARRELWEETGYKATRLIKLQEMHDYPSKDSHGITVYFTQDVTLEEHDHKEATEDIEIVYVPLEQIDEYIEKGEIEVAGSIAGVSLAKHYLAKNTY